MSLARPKHYGTVRCADTYATRDLSHEFPCASPSGSRHCGELKSACAQHLPILLMVTRMLLFPFVAREVLNQTVSQGQEAMRCPEILQKALQFDQWLSALELSRSLELSIPSSSLFAGSAVHSHAQPINLLETGQALALGAGFWFLLPAMLRRKQRSVRFDHCGFEWLDCGLMPLGTLRRLLSTTSLPHSVFALKISCQWMSVQQVMGSLVCTRSLQKTM